jgi:hypothetical protein
MNEYDKKAEIGKIQREYDSEWKDKIEQLDPNKI